MLGVGLLGGAVEAQVPYQNFWPFPTPTELGSANHWWKFTWTNGGSHYNGSCAQGVSQNTLTYLDNNELAFNGDDRVVVRFIKDDDCAYWAPGKDWALKWYGRGWQEATGTDDGLGDTLNFLSFRGWSVWQPTPDKVTQAYKFPPALGGTPFHQIEQGFDGYLDNTGVTQIHLEDGNEGTRAAAEARMPAYTLVADEALNLDLIVSSIASNTSLTQDGTNRGNLSGDPGSGLDPVTYHGCPAFATINDLNSGTAACESPAAPGAEENWRLYVRETQYLFEGKPVVYAGFAEGTEGYERDQNGDLILDPQGNPIPLKLVCEEWFLAKDVGPIAVAQLPLTTSVAGCLAQLALNDCNGDGVGDGFDTDDFSSPEDYYQNILPRIQGYKVLDDRCASSNCSIYEADFHKTWTFKSQLECASGDLIAEQPTRLRRALWPPNPVVWHSSPLGLGDKTVTFSSDDPVNSGYLRLVTQSGTALRPIGPKPHPELTYATFFSQWGARWPAKDLPSGTYTIKFRAPASWCGTSTPSPSCGDGICSLSESCFTCSGDCCPSSDS
ncbi:MAG: hypothetical protein MI919_04585 [Holophagales bacterium]|nr:hypothetical protein [Holophagales bacterium]